MAELTDKNAPVEVVLENTGDPFEAANAPGQLLIVAMRLYDLLSGIYTELDADKATALLELHQAGKLALPPPILQWDSPQEN